MTPMNAFDAVGPAWERMKQMLFRPFNFEKWIALGLLCFLQMCAGMGVQSGCSGSNFNIPTGIPDLGSLSREIGHEESSFLPSVDDAQGALVSSGLQFEDPLADATKRPDKKLEKILGWMRAHRTLVIGLGIILLALIIGLTVLFQWLGSRAAFAYIDNIVANRGEVDAPWKRYAALGDSFWRFRLGYIAIVWVVMLGLLIPSGLIVYRTITGPRPDIGIQLLHSAPLWALAVALLLAVSISALVDVAFFDVVAPIQYVRCSTTGPAIDEAWKVIATHVGAFLLYLVLKILLAIGFAVGIVVFGFLTCCCGFVAMIIPVIGQAVLQPIWVLHRSISLYFLQQLGPTYDVFDTVTPK